MKYRRFIKYALLVTVFITVSCTDEFQEMNVDPNKLKVENIQETVYLLPDFFRYALRNDHFVYQRADQLHSNQFAQYFSNTNGSFTTGQYQYRDDWAFEMWYLSFYGGPNLVLQDVKTRYDLDPAKNNNTLQLVRIVRATCAAFTTDHWGDIPYFEAGIGNTNPGYDKQEDIYADIFKELKEAAEAITPDVSDPLLNQYDFIYENNFRNWIILANSLRLRYALRISEVNPEWARQEGEAALAAGVMDNFDQSARCFVDPEDISDQRGNPLFAISDWNEFRMSSLMENYLEGLSSIVDPREAVWFQPAENYPNNDPDEPAGNEFKGLPNGLNSSQLSEQGWTFGDNSNIWREGPYFDRFRRLNVMTYAEVCFLKAEAALRGWAGAGNAQTNYEEGIRASMQETTFTNAGMEPFAPIAESDISAYLAGGDVPYNSSGSFEEQLKQIIIQKWLAVFPQGHEAWADFRRTGYPDLIPVANNLDSDIPEGEFIKKIRLVQNEYLLNQSLTPDVQQSLNNGQGDHQNARVWWDID